MLVNGVGGTCSLVRWDGGGCIYHLIKFFLHFLSFLLNLFSTRLRLLFLTEVRVGGFGLAIFGSPGCGLPGCGLGGGFGRTRCDRRNYFWNSRCCCKTCDNMWVSPADAEDGISLDVPDDCDPGVGHRFAFFFEDRGVYGVGLKRERGFLARVDRRRVSVITSSSRGVVL